MAINASKVRRLPSPPPIEEGAAGIDRAPEPPPVPAPAAQVMEPAPAPVPVVDGRSLRATGRTAHLNLKATAETREHIVRIAQEQGWLMAEVIEHAIRALNEQLDRK